MHHVYRLNFFHRKHQKPKLVSGKQLMIEPLCPEFVSVTYGADGSTRERTHQVIKDILTKTSSGPLLTSPASVHRKKKLIRLPMNIGAWA